MPTVSETLNLAADLIEKRGWTEGDWGTDSETAPMCLEGALLGALGSDRRTGADHVDCPAFRAVHNYLNLDDGLRLYNWNDNSQPGGLPVTKHRRTASEVVEVLRAAAIIEAAKLVDVRVVTA